MADQVPEEAITAAVEYARSHGIFAVTGGTVGQLLQAAAPAIRADERERIAELAFDRDAEAWSAPLDANECHRVPFADLVRGQS